MPAILSEPRMTEAINTHLLAKLGTLRQLEIFLKVADVGGIMQAAEQLHLTQPSVSMQVKKLSDVIGLPLYEQIGRKIFLTDAGRSVAAASREILDALNRLDMQLNDLKGVKGGRLSIAVVTSAKYFLPHLLGPFCRRYPGIHVEFKVGNREQILERLANNQDDMYFFSHPPADMNIQCHPFLPNPLVVMASANHPLAGRKNLHWNDLLNERFLLREQGSGTRYAVLQHLQQHGLKIKTAMSMTIESNEAIKHAVMANLGIAVLSAYSLVHAEEEGLVQLDVQEFPVMTVWQLVHLQEKKLSIVAQRFLEFVLQEGREHLPMDKIEARVRAAQRKELSK
jgi:DNA-binding transcriptional LysR family regulator